MTRRSSRTVPTKGPREKRRRRDRATIDAVDALITESVLLYFRMKVAAADLMGEGARSAARRGVLRELAKHGPRAVPQMARARPVSRQHMQKVVNGLRADGLIEFRENPAHRRSPLVELTAKGKVYVQRLARREEVLLGQLAADLDLVDLRTAAAVLRTLRAGFQSERWKELLRASR